jgi:hypothetical protein
MSEQNIKNILDELENTIDTADDCKETNIKE